MEWITALTACLTLLITITGYFVKKHIESVEKNIKELQKKTTSLKQDVIWMTNNIEDIKRVTQDSNLITREKSNLILSKIEQLDDMVYNNKIMLKKHETDLENYGKVIRKKFLTDKK